MPVVVLLRDIQVGMEPHQAGDVVTVDEYDAHVIVRGGHGRLASTDDITSCTAPRPAADIRAEIEAIATAVPGGKRPGRKYAQR